MDSTTILIRRLTVGVIFFMLILSASLWLPIRNFPVAPVFYSLPVLPDWLCTSIYVTLMGLLILIYYAKQASLPILLFNLLFWSYCLFDYSRIQVYYMVFSLMLAGLGLIEYLQKKKLEEDYNEIMNGIRLFFVSCYFFSGLYKLNGGFYDSVIPWFVEPITQTLGITHTPSWVGISIAIIELIAGLLLLFTITRKTGVALIISIHLFILICIGPFGHKWNLIVWPWNIMMATFSFLLFWNFKGNVLGKWKPSLSTQFKLIVLIVFGFLPFLFPLGKWDSFFSFDLYSGKTKLGAIYLSEDEISKLPEDVQKYVFTSPSSNNRYLDLSNWGLGELKTLPYPEIRAFHKMHRSFSQKYFHKPSVGSLVIYSHYTVWKSKQEGK